MRKVGRPSLRQPRLATRHRKMGHMLIQVSNNAQTFSHPDKFFGLDKFAIVRYQTRKRFISHG